MRLVAIDNPRPGQTVQCCHCDRMQPVDETRANLDGPAFRSYWCRQCVAWANDGEINDLSTDD